MTINSNYKISSFAACCIVMVAILAGLEGNSRIAIAALIGGMAGYSLYHAKFGFTAAWHRFFSQRRGGGLRAQILLIILTSAITFQIFQYGSVFGINAFGYVQPFGVSAALGAFAFGLGMQLGGSCASGTLFTVGGGSTRMVVTLIFFILGSVIATAHLPQWSQLPKLPAISLIREFGGVTAILITTAVLGGIAGVSILIERKAHGGIEKPEKTASMVSGPWSFLLGALALTVVSVGTVMVLGRPWGVTSGFALWGAKWFYGLGIPIDTWEYWSNRMGSVNRSVFTHATSVMNFGIIFGAMLASGLAGRFSPLLKIDGKSIVTAVIGGFLMGYGARLAYGCNIGAYLGGIISGSIHGWGWLVFGFMGSIVGSKIRMRWMTN